jgi:hypothetical protein
VVSVSEIFFAVSLVMYFRLADVRVKLESVDWEMGNAKVSVINRSKRMIFIKPMNMEFESRTTVEKYTVFAGESKMLDFPFAGEEQGFLEFTLTNSAGKKKKRIPLR